MRPLRGSSASRSSPAASTSTSSSGATPSPSPSRWAMSLGDARSLAACAALVALCLGARPAQASVPFEEIIRTAPSHSHADSCELMKAWVDEHRDDPRAPRGLIWMGQLMMNDGLPDRARPYFERTQRE